MFKLMNKICNQYFTLKICLCVLLSFVSDIAKDIIDLSVHGAAQNQSYNRLANFTDKFGYRLAGSKNLEDAIGKY